MVSKLLHFREGGNVLDLIVPQHKRGDVAHCHIDALQRPNAVGGEVEAAEVVAVLEVLDL